MNYDIKLNWVKRKIAETRTDDKWFTMNKII